MALAPPTVDQLRATADRMGFSLGEGEAREYGAMLAGVVAAYGTIDRMSDELPPVRWPRTPGTAPAPADNPHNAWARRTSVKGPADGPLAGRRVALKDNIMLAGVPMMNGASTLEGYVPEVDATIVTRLLDAGAEIVGKAHCEYYCASGGSHTCAAGPVHNPWRHGWSAGGSSSGSAALVAAGEVDMAVGGDQGGSIRMPASFCGIVGLKPTWGLVPYTGIMSVDPVIDHAGPMTRTVADNARYLEVMAGDDGYDPRIKAPEVRQWSRLLDGGARGLRVAVVTEGFGRPESNPAVDAKVRAAAALLARLGAEVSEVSIPMHLSGPAIWMPIAIEGMAQTALFGDGFGSGRMDLYVGSLMSAQRRWRTRADELSPTVKLLGLMGTHVHSIHGTRFYGKAVNLSRRLRAAYDAVLADHDLLLMPTTPMTARPMPDPGVPLAEFAATALDTVGNTSPFDVTHHPSISIPCGLADGLPVGLMLTGRHFDEATVYRAAHAFEQAGDWKAM
jgi:amidase